jgi:hypothetical protein
VWNLGLVLVGWVFGTLLGPEESGAGIPGGVWGLVVSWWFDIWIVDASIARTCAPSWPESVLGGVVVCGCLFL